MHKHRIDVALVAKTVLLIIKKNIDRYSAGGSLMGTFVQ